MHGTRTPWRLSFADIPFSRRGLAGIESATVHTHRHTFGAHAAMAGVPMPTLKERMGHADIKTTMVYVHVDRQHQAEAVNRISLGTPRREANVVPLAAAREAGSGSETGTSRSRMLPNRRFTIHAYFAVDWDVVWTTAIDDAPAITEAVREVIAKVPREGGRAGTSFCRERSTSSAAP